MCALQYSRETELEVSPQPKLRKKCSDFFFQQLPNPWLVIFHMACTAPTIQPSFLPSLYPCSLAHLSVFWFSIFSSLTFPFSLSFPTDCFPSFRILCLQVSFLFTATEFSLHCCCPHCQALLCIYIHIFTWSARHRSPGKSKHLPKGRDDSVLVADLLTERD